MTDNGGVAYERDVLENFDPRRRPTYPKVVAVTGLVVEDRSSGFCGDIVKTSFEAVTLRDRKGHLRHFTWKDGGFLLEGKRVTLVREEVAKPTGPRLTASGSIASDGPQHARVARASRIWVEGRHDAELLEHVWGDDLRELGIVVEPMHGIDHLVEAVREFGPSPERRLGILVDHLVEGSKEWRLAAAVRSEYVLVTGHPFVDVWAGIRPKAVGRESWPEVPRGIPWKEGMARALGTELTGLWPKLRNRVKTYADLEPELVGAVERLLDFLA
jgi:hypothetical protein